MAATTSPKRILVALAWPYASGPRHLGHVAGFGVPADIFARYHRLKGNQVLMVSGTDEHGTPILVAADKEKTTPQEIATRYNIQIADDLANLGLSYDLFTRTTTENHYRVVQDMFLALHAKGYLKLEKAMGAFSSVTGRTLPDRYIEGTCPICGFEDARGDQCEQCGNQLDPQDLRNARSRIDGQPPVFRETEHFFFDLAAFGEQLTQWLATRTHWRPNVIAYSQNFINELRPRPITRDLDWGVPIPLEGWRERDDKRIYVWFDAVMGYLSASIEWATVTGTPEAWKQWWMDPEAEHYYFMGKDNIIFHTVMWPAILLGYGGLELPHEVVASEFLTMEGKKLSSSRGGAIYVNDFLSRYEPDPLRYFVTVAGPENQDTDFTWSEFVRRNNDELVNNWGNLVNRVLVNAHRNFGEVPPPGDLTERDVEVLGEIASGFDSTGRLIERASLQAAIKEAMRLSSIANFYLAEQEPWKVIKSNRDRAATVLHVGLRLVDSLKVIFAPFLPFSSQRVHEMLGHPGQLAGPIEKREVTEDRGSTHRVLTGNYADWVGGWQPPELPAGQKLGEPQPIFRKLDPEKVVAEELARMGLHQ
ncbi:MAG: methionine--tRNA ligase [Candidatus Dormibacteraeota bacterium]|nr:methionine--tRNA ligase [Candidatus Dormibacteraeota bacterium]